MEYRVEFYYDEKLANTAKMSLEKIREFAKEYIGTDYSEPGCVFVSIEDIDDAIDYLESEATETWLVGETVHGKLKIVISENLDKAEEIQ